MNTDKENKFIYKDLSYKIVGLAMEAHSKLGQVFLEKVYENALMVQFKKAKHNSNSTSTNKSIF